MSDNKQVSSLDEAATEYATQMMGIGEYSEKWHYGDKTLWNNLKRAYKQGAETWQSQLSMLTKEETKPVEDKADLKIGWTMGLTYAHNLCAQISDEYNDDDEIEWARAAGHCAKKIRADIGYYSPEIENQPPKPVSEEGCAHEALIDTGVGYHYCPACKESFKLPDNF